MGLNWDAIAGTGIAGLQIGGGMVQARGQREAGDAAAAAALYNARLAEQRAYAEGARRRLAAKYELGEERAQMGASGLTPTGSPLRAYIANVRELERDALDVELAGRQTAALERAQASNLRKMGERRSRAAMLSGISDAARFGLPLLVK
jgi:hypothetical protein